MTSGRVRTVVTIAYLGAFIVGCWVAVVTGVRHDYIAFSSAWSNINEGRNPWAPKPYAYGPVFNAFALVERLGELGPKMLFFMTWMISSMAISAVALRASMMRFGVVFLMLVVNPLMVISIAVFGQFDVVVGVASIAAAVLWRRGMAWPAGVALGIGVLLKLFPLVLVPVLVASGAASDLRSRGRRSLLFCSTVAGTVLIGWGISALIWGGRSVTEPLTFSSERDPKLTSVFRYLTGEYRPIEDLPFDPSSLSVPALVVAVLLVASWSFRCRADPVLASALAMVSTFALYKVGHPQFVVVSTMFLALWVSEVDRVPRRLAAAVVAYVCWYGLVQVGYLWTAVSHDAQFGFREGWAWVREIVGLPTFVISVWLMLEIARSGNRLRPERAESSVAPVHAVGS